MRTLIYLSSVLALGGCAAMPHDGPSADVVQSSAAQKRAQFAIVDLNYRVTQAIAAQPTAALVGLQKVSSDAPNDLINEGDVVAVSVFEAGSGGLFAHPTLTPGTNTPDTFPRLVVDTRGNLTIPFAGDIHVAGLRPKAAAEMIRRAMTGRAVDPQVTVNLLESAGNSVSILGEVARTGRYALSPSNDRLLDVIASAGGPTKVPADTEVVVVRGLQSAKAPLSEILRDPAENIRLAPRDQVRLVFKPRRYSTFGAFAHNTQVSIEDDSVTLAGAISRGGGLDPISANGAAVFIFRFERPQVATALGVTTPVSPKGVPIVYRLNLRAADGYFIANTFEIEPDDLIFVPRAKLAEAQQFLNFVSAVSAITYNARVTSVLP